MDAAPATVRVAVRVVAAALVMQIMVVTAKECDAVLTAAGSGKSWVPVKGAWLASVTIFPVVGNVT